jgi:hypothetical protein
VFHRSISRTRFGLASAAVVALLVLSAGSVAADTGPGGDGTFNQKGNSADAFAGGCLSNGDDTSTCWDVGLSGFAGKMSDSLSGVTHTDQVCVFRDGYTVVDATGELLADPVSEGGCKADLPTGTLRFGKDLAWVTLATTAFEIHTCRSRCIEI